MHVYSSFNELSEEINHFSCSIGCDCMGWGIISFWSLLVNVFLEEVLCETLENVYVGTFPFVLKY